MYDVIYTIKFWVYFECMCSFVEGKIIHPEKCGKVEWTSLEHGNLCVIVFVLLPCSLIRQAHGRGANIILIQVCNDLRLLPFAVSDCVPLPLLFLFFLSKPRAECIHRHYILVASPRGVLHSYFSQ